MVVEVKVGGVGGEGRSRGTPHEQCMLHARMGSHLECGGGEEEVVVVDGLAWGGKREGGGLFRHRTRSPTHTHVSFKRHTMGRTY